MNEGFLTDDGRFSEKSILVVAAFYCLGLLYKIAEYLRITTYNTIFVLYLYTVRPLFYRLFILISIEFYTLALSLSGWFTLLSVVVVFITTTSFILLILRLKYVSKPFQATSSRVQLIRVLASSDVAKKFIDVSKEYNKSYANSNPIRLILYIYHRAFSTHILIRSSVILAQASRYICTQILRYEVTIIYTHILIFSSHRNK